MLSIIVAVDENGAIGYRNNLLCKIPQELQRFKSLTMGHKVLVGRKTFESITSSLPGRHVVVVTRNTNYSAQVCTNLQAFLEKNQNTPEEIFIIGGTQIYEQSLPYVKKIYMTYIKKKFDKADTFFPKFEKDNWSEELSPLYFDPKNNLHFYYADYFISSKTIL